MAEALSGHTLDDLENERQLSVLKILLASLVSVQWEFCGQCCKSPRSSWTKHHLPICVCLSRLTVTCGILRTPGLQEHTYLSPCHSMQQRAATPATCTRQSHYFISIRYQLGSYMDRVTKSCNGCTGGKGKLGGYSRCYLRKSQVFNTCISESNSSETWIRMNKWLQIVCQSCSLLHKKVEEIWDLNFLYLSASINIVSYIQ